MLASLSANSPPKLCRDVKWVDMLTFPPENIVCTMATTAIVDAAEGTTYFQHLRKPRRMRM